MDRADLGALFLHFLLLSFLAIGGTPDGIPDMHRYVAEVHHWMSSAEFATLYALAQVAPVPTSCTSPSSAGRWRGGRGGCHHPSPARARRHPDPARRPPGCPASPGGARARACAAA